MTKLVENQPAVRWATPTEYSYRCGVCGEPAFVQAMEGDMLCRKCLDERRKI